MIIGAIIVLIILSIIFLFISGNTYEDMWGYFSAFSFILAFLVFIFGCFHGFIDYPKTEGTHQGIITAVDREGAIFNHYKVYLKSSGYTNQSDETVYCLYSEELELANELKENIGKQVKLNYGHDGGYIGYKSCGTYHIKSFEVVEESR